MALSNGQKIGLIAAVGAGAFLLASGGSSAKAANPAPAKDPCIDINLAAAAAAASATKADIPVLQAMLEKAKSLGCADAANQLALKISDLSVDKPGPTPGPSGGGTIIFSASKIKDRQRLINDAWTLARMGPLAPLADDIGKYHLDTNGSFGNVSDAFAYAATGKPIIDVQTNKSISRSPGAIVLDLQSAAGLTVDGKWGAQTNAAFSWGLHNGSPSSIGGEGLDHACVGGECGACMGKKKAEIGNPESFSAYNTLVQQDDGYFKFDRAFGSEFGRGPRAKKDTAFGQNSRWGY